jgi:formylglycine-generating enzyme required for sulfatase activity
MEFVWIPSGKFMMGQTEVDQHYLTHAFGEEECRRIRAVELPRHEVEVDGFWLGKYPVTQEQWGTVMGENVVTPRSWTPKSRSLGDN